jgi:hypothetical protein
MACLPGLYLVMELTDHFHPNRFHPRGLGPCWCTSSHSLPFKALTKAKSVGPFTGILPQLSRREKPAHLRERERERESKSASETERER